MKKNKISNLAKAGLALGALSGLGLLDAHAGQNMGFSVLGTGSSVRSEMVQKNLKPSSNAPVYLSSHEKEGEGKCGEGKCGDNKDKDGGEGSCGEGHDDGDEGGE